MRKTVLAYCIFNVILAPIIACSEKYISPQDIQGPAHIFIQRPANPSVRARRDAKAQKVTAGAQSQTAEAKNLEAAKQKRADLKEETDEALALGNSSRDAKPPRHADAERAYRLAARLSPNDPRPFVGLGNIYFDQKLYEESAKAYKEALRLAALNPSILSIIGGRFGTEEGAAGAIVATRKSEHAELHAYIGNIWLAQKRWAEAESELRDAVSNARNNPQWHALLGFALFEQKKFTEASFFYKQAVELEPQNAVYKSLYEQSLKEHEK